MMLENRDYYQFACVAAAHLYFFLFYLLQFNPEKLTSDLGLVGNDVASLFIQRASILMLGFGVLLIFGGGVEEVKGRFAISIGVSVCMLGLALMSALEFAKSNVGNGIMPALLIETVVGITFLLLAISNWPYQTGR